MSPIRLKELRSLEVSKLLEMCEEWDPFLCSGVCILREVQKGNASFQLVEDTFVQFGIEIDFDSFIMGGLSHTVLLRLVVTSKLLFNDLHPYDRLTLSQFCQKVDTLALLLEDIELLPGVDIRDEYEDLYHMDYRSYAERLHNSLKLVDYVTILVISLIGANGDM